MKRATITMDGSGRVAVPSDIANVWMSEMELVTLFDVIAPTLRAAVRAVYRSGVLQSCEVERRIRLPMPQECVMSCWKGCACEKTDKCFGFR